MKYLFLLFAIFILFGAAPSVFAATLSLSPSFANYVVGDFFDVNIILNTQGISTDGVDIKYFNYNPGLLEVQDADSGAAGTQITSGSLMPVNIINNIDTASGKIQFSQSSIGGSSYNGADNLATIRFKALSAGTANVSFDYTSGNTTDTNVASGGADVLNSITNGSYVIAAAGSGGSGSTSGGGSTGGSSGGGGGGGGSSGSIYTANSLPNLPSLVRQFVNNGLVTLSEGAKINDTIIYFKAVISDPNNDQVKLRVEIRSIADSFTDFSDGGILETAFMPSGSTVSITKRDLSKGSYKWRYQVIDNNGGITAWSEFGVSGNIDFSISSQAGLQTTIQSTAQSKNSGNQSLQSTTTSAAFVKISAYNFNKNLKYGLKGDSDIKQLQKVLAAEGLFSNDESLMSGNFFSMTRDAVIKFQQKYGISPASGYVGALTRGKLNSLYNNVSGGAPIVATSAQLSSGASSIFIRNLYLGIRGDDVIKLQNILIKDGVYNGYASGYYGPLTTGAVLKFQNKYNISGGNGFFGPKTRAKLIELYHSL